MTIPFNYQTLARLGMCGWEDVSYICSSSSASRSLLQYYTKLSGLYYCTNKVWLYHERVSPVFAMQKLPFIIFSFQQQLSIQHLLVYVYNSPLQIFQPAVYLSRSNCNCFQYSSWMLVTDVRDLDFDTRGDCVVRMRLAVRSRQLTQPEYQVRIKEVIGICCAMIWRACSIHTCHICLSNQSLSYSCSRHLCHRDFLDEKWVSTPCAHGRACVPYKSDAPEDWPAWLLMTFVQQCCCCWVHITHYPKQQSVAENHCTM